jgi:bifunctional non-homologous end joining protein LigD
MSKFILVEHKAIKKGLHWDLRFEIPNSKNWASFVFNKFPPLEPGQRVYIPRSNDHSESEALFVGKIDEGSYGAGVLKKIDGGDCEVMKYSNAHIVVNFKGKKLSGLYHFINAGVFGRNRNYKSKVYTFFKAKDQNLKKND